MGGGGGGGVEGGKGGEGGRGGGGNSAKSEFSAAVSVLERWGEDLPAGIGDRGSRE